MSRNFRSYSGLLALTLVLCLVFSITVFAGNGNKFGHEKVKLKGMKMMPKQANQVPYGLMKKGYKSNEVGPYIIIFNGPVKEEMKEMAIRKGAKLEEYLPDFSFLAQMTPEEAEQVKALSFIEDVVIYQPAFKVHPKLKDEFGKVKKYGNVTVRITTFGKDTSVLTNAIINAHGKRLGHGKGHVTVNMNSGQLVKFAHMNSVKYIEEKPKFELLNDVAVGYMDVDDLWTLGYDGTNQVVGVCDTGLDTGVNDSTMHQDFQGRIDAIHALGRSTADDPNGHGTHVAGSVLGDGSRSNGQHKGAAPAANLVFQSVLDSGGGLGGLPNDLNTLFSQAWNDGARIHTNSWGAAVNGDYTTSAQQVDEYVWNNDMIVLFAAGNEGDDSYGNYPYYETIGSPGSAKNCITVGATENYRPNMMETMWGNVGDDPNQIAPFSSRGNTADGRIKPDIVAPGTWILSTKSSVAPESNYWSGYNEYYAYMGGTSMATPLTAGAVAVARQYMQENWNHTPSPAMMKAAVINGATDLGFGVPSKDQGWGRISLVNALTSKEYKYDDETVSLGTGQSQTYSYAVESTNIPLRLSLVWTDYPGSTTASKALVNDLDLTITSPSGTVYYGNDFSSPYNSSYDRLNNVENIWINSPEVGTYTIEVNGYNVPQGPQPFALYASGDFGTVSSDTTPPTCELTAPSAGATVSDSITLSATASDNESVSRVDFYVGSNKVGSDNTSPYSISWDSNTVANGTYNVEAVAFDTAGNSTTSSAVSITVDNVVTTTYVTDTFSGKVNKSETYQINVTATGTIDLDLSWNDGATLSMNLYDPAGNKVATGTTTISYNATTTGTYDIEVVRSNNGKPTSFDLTATYPVVQ